MDRGAVQREPDETAFEFIVRRALNGSGDWTITSQTLVPLTASATAGQARVFCCDPASLGPADGYRARRPTRDDTTLDLYRVDETEPIPLEHSGYVTVMQSRFVLGDDPAGGPKSVDLPAPGDQTPPPPVRRNDFSAVSTFRNLDALFARLDLYGPTPTIFSCWLVCLSRRSTARE